MHESAAPETKTGPGGAARGAAAAAPGVNWYGRAGAPADLTGGRSERCGQRRSIARVGGKVKSWRDGVEQLCVSRASAADAARVFRPIVTTGWIRHSRSRIPGYDARSRFRERVWHLLSGRLLRVRAKSAFNTVDMAEFGAGPTDDDKIIAELHPVRAPPACGRAALVSGGIAGSIGAANRKPARTLIRMQQYCHCSSSTADVHARA